MKTTILIFLLSIGWLNSQAQQDDVITYSEFESIKFNSHTLKQYIDLENIEAFLEDNYGVPSNKECFENPMTTYGCEINYNGFELVFDYVNVISRITLSGGSNSFIYKNKHLRVGMSIFELKNMFPDSYNNRYNVELDGNIEHYMRVCVNRQFSNNLIRFKLNTSLNIISEISIRFEGEG